MSTNTAEQNKALVLEAFDTLFNRRDYVAAEPFWSPDYIQHSAHIGPGRDGLFNLIRSLPDTLRYEPGAIVGEGNFVIVHGRFSGFGQPVNWIAADILRIENGVLVEHWDVIQNEAGAEQVGDPLDSGTHCGLRNSEYVENVDQDRTAKKQNQSAKDSLHEIATERGKGEDRNIHDQKQPEVARKRRRDRFSQRETIRQPLDHLGQKHRSLRHDQHEKRLAHQQIPPPDRPHKPVLPHAGHRILLNRERGSFCFRCGIGCSCHAVWRPKNAGGQFAFTGAGTVWLFSLLLPWTPAFAAGQRFSRAPRSGSAITLSLNRSADGFRRSAENDVSEPIRKLLRTVYIPLRIENLPGDSMLLIDREHARFVAGGSSVDANASNGHIPVDSVEGVHLTPIGLSAAWLAQHENEPVHVELEYSLTLVSLASGYSIAPAGGALRSPDLGWCESRINIELTGVEMRCMRPGKLPDAIAFRLENTATGLHNPERISYMANYSPYLLAFIPDSMRRAGANLPLRDESGVARYPVDASQLKNAQVAIRTFTARDHFTRNLAIDGVRLNHWRGLGSHGL